jgi:predicted RNA methylase
MVFESDPIDLIDTAVLTGEVVDKKKEFQFFETTDDISEQMIELADVKADENALEPSAGRGAIARKLLRITPHVDIVELNKENYEYLLKGGYRTCINQDFLMIDAGYKYDKIVMNPPFCKQQDIDHVLHACQLLKESGTLVSVMSEGTFFRDNQKAKIFRTMLSEYGYSIPLDEGAFKESGTMVKTRLVVIKNH